MNRLFYFFLLLCSYPCKTISQNRYDVFISHSGNDSNSGTTPLLPKQTFTGAIPVLNKFAFVNGKVSIGLKSGESFNDALTPFYPVQVGTYFDPSVKNNFAVLNGSDEYNTGWVRAAGSSHIFQQAIQTTGFSGETIGGYNYIFVIEIDKELEKISPLTARKILVFAPSLAAADTIPGSFYEPAGIIDNILVSIHTSDGKSPNLHSKYRYEVAVRNRAINAYDYDNNRFENIMVRGYGAGYGLIPGGVNSYFNKIIFGPGAATHHVVLKSGTINNSLFLPGPKNLNSIAVTFYNAEGFKRHNKIVNSIFLDIPNAIYSHTSDASNSNYASVELNNVVAFADSSQGGQFMSTSDNDSVKLNNVYTDKYTIGFNVGHNNISAKHVTIKNSYFKDVTTGIAFGSNDIQASISNVFIKSDAMHYVSGISMQNNTSLKLTNSILHIKATGNTGAFIVGSGGVFNNISATGNIFIGDVDAENIVNVAVTNTDKGIGTSSDIWSNNVYVLLRGDKMVWAVTNRATNEGNNWVQSFNEWKKQSGQDRNSLFFDLRNDRRGLKAIFTDPDNGDYELAETPEGNKIRALRAGMTNPITCFLKKPTYEEAAAIIREGKVLSANSCKSPCLRTTIRVNTQFSTAILNNSQIKLQWNVKDRQNIHHFEIERAVGSSQYLKISETLVVNDSTYTFIDIDIQPNLIYHYRLAVVTNTGYKCYSVINTATPVYNKLSMNIYPNPSPGKINILVNGYTGIANLIISNSIGQTILEKELNIETSIAQLIDLTRQLKGVYWLRLKTHDGRSLQSFLVK